MGSKILLGLLILSASLTHANPCYQTPANDRSGTRLTFLWPQGPKDVGQLAVKIGAHSRVADVSCTASQPYLCKIDGDLGRFTLVPDGSRLELVIKSGALALTTEFSDSLEAAVVPGTATTYALEIKHDQTCAKRFGAGQPTLTFP